MEEEEEPEVEIRRQLRQYAKAPVLSVDLGNSHASLQSAHTPFPAENKRKPQSRPF